MAKQQINWDHRIGRRITLRDLHILSFVVRSGSMAKAAGHLATSQSVVSDAIANLESAIGVRLLDRSAKGVEPTIHAETLLKRSHVVFDALREAVHEIEALASSTAGEVRIACSEFLASGLIPDALEGFSRRYPDIACEIVDADATNLEFRQLHERSVDLILARVPTAFAADDLNIEVLFADPHLVVAGGNSPWIDCGNLTLSDLSGEPWIIPASVIVREIMAEAFAAEGASVPKGKIVSSFVMMRGHLLATGRFLTVLPASVLKHIDKRWALHALPIKLRAKPRPIAIITLKHRSISPATQLFIDCLRDTARNYARPPRRKRTR
jgi:DNA-binding transcriptional LysR family regulator